MPLARQVMILYAAINGYLDDIPVNEVGSFEANFHAFMEANHPGIGETITGEKEISTETEEALKTAIAGFKQDLGA